MRRENRPPGLRFLLLLLLSCGMPFAVPAAAQDQASVPEESFGEEDFEPVYEDITDGAPDQPVRVPAPTPMPGEEAPEPEAMEDGDGLEEGDGTGGDVPPAPADNLSPAEEPAPPAAAAPVEAVIPDGMEEETPAEKNGNGTETGSENVLVDLEKKKAEEEKKKEDAAAREKEEDDDEGVYERKSKRWWGRP